MKRMWPSGMFIIKFGGCGSTLKLIRTTSPLCNTLELQIQVKGFTSNAKLASRGSTSYFWLLALSRGRYYKMWAPLSEWFVRSVPTDSLELRQRNRSKIHLIHFYNFLFAFLCWIHRFPGVLFFHTRAESRRGAEQSVDGAPMQSDADETVF